MTRGDILRWFILIKLAKTIFFLNIHSKVKVLFRRRYERRFTYSQYPHSPTCAEIKNADLTLRY